MHLFEETGLQDRNTGWTSYKNQRVYGSSISQPETITNKNCLQIIDAAILNLA